MSSKEYKALGEVDLKNKVVLLKSRIVELKLKNGLGQVANPLEIRSLRRDLARVLTVLSEKNG